MGDEYMNDDRNNHFDKERLMHCQLEDLIFERKTKRYVFHIQAPLDCCFENNVLYQESLPLCD